MAKQLHSQNPEKTVIQKDTCTPMGSFNVTEETNINKGQLHLLCCHMAASFSFISFNIFLRRSSQTIPSNGLLFYKSLILDK